MTYHSIVGTLLLILIAVTIGFVLYGLLSLGDTTNSLLETDLDNIPEPEYKDEELGIPPKEEHVCNYGECTCPDSCKNKKRHKVTAESNIDDDIYHIEKEIIKRRGIRKDTKKESINELETKIETMPLVKPDDGMGVLLMAAVSSKIEEEDSHDNNINEDAIIHQSSKVEDTQTHVQHKHDEPVIHQSSHTHESSSHDSSSYHHTSYDYNPSSHDSFSGNYYDNFG